MPCPDPRPKYRPLNCAEDDKKFPCVEIWGPDGTSKRFALGTRANFVVDRFNKKLVDAVKPVVCVEAFKHGEELVEFDPDAPLMAMCDWDLRVVQEAPFEPSYLDDDGKLQCYGIYDLVREKRVVFFGVPGAFTPPCSEPWVLKEWEKTYPDNKHLKLFLRSVRNMDKEHRAGAELDRPRHARSVSFPGGGLLQFTAMSEEVQSGPGRNLFLGNVLAVNGHHQSNGVRGVK